MTEVGTVFSLFQQVFSQILGLAHFVGIHALGGRNQDVSDVIFDCIVDVKAGLVGQESIDFTFRNVDLGFDFTFTQTLHRDLAADLFTELIERNFIVGQTLTKLSDRQLVLSGDLFDRDIDQCVIDTNTRFTSTLLNGTVHDQVFEHLSLQLRHRRQLDVLATQVQSGRMYAFVQFIGRDHIGVNNSHNAVERLRVDRLVGSEGRRRTNACGDGGKQRQFGHFIHSSHITPFVPAQPMLHGNPECCVAIHLTDSYQSNPNPSILIGYRSLCHSDRRP